MKRLGDHVLSFWHFERQKDEGFETDKHWSNTIAAAIVSFLCVQIKVNNVKWQSPRLRDIKWNPDSQTCLIVNDPFHHDKIPLISISISQSRLPTGSRTYLTTSTGDIWSSLFFPNSQHCVLISEKKRCVFREWESLERLDKQICAIRGSVRGCMRYTYTHDWNSLRAW